MPLMKAVGVAQLSALRLRHSVGGHGGGGARRRLPFASLERRKKFSDSESTTNESKARCASLEQTVSEVKYRTDVNMITACWRGECPVASQRHTGGCGAAVM